MSKPPHNKGNFVNGPFIIKYLTGEFLMIDPVANIMDTMTSKKSKPAIKKKLLELGLVSDMKELRKKRSGKSGGKKTSKNPWGSEDVVDDGIYFITFHLRNTYEMRFSEYIIFTPRYGVYKMSTCDLLATLLHLFGIYLSY